MYHNLVVSRIITLIDRFECVFHVAKFSVHVLVFEKLLISLSFLHILILAKAFGAKSVLHVSLPS